MSDTEHDARRMPTPSSTPAAQRGAPATAGGAAPGSASASGRSNAELQALDRRVLWHPFTQQRGWDTEDFPVIVAAEGCELFGQDEFFLRLHELVKGCFQFFFCIFQVFCAFSHTVFQLLVEVP